MNSESPANKVKSCNSCKRLLPDYYFGLRKFSADGYNPCCKECRNFRKRRAYQKPTDPLDPILPLSDHNRHFLWALTDSSKNENLIGLDLKNLKAVKVTFKFNRCNQFLLWIKIASGVEYTHIHHGKKAEFIEFVLPILTRLHIRLFHSQDIVALSNWGLRVRT